MATTYMHPLKSVMSSMVYTDIGNGDKRKLHLAEGTSRAADEIGDLSREEFAHYCEGIHQTKHPRAKYEGYEIRISWGKDELNPDNSDDLARAREHSYMVCKTLFPHSLCYVTVHVDGKGGCVHTHCAVANHDEETEKVLNMNRRHCDVERVSDKLAAEEGMRVLGTPAFVREQMKESTMWVNRREECEGFDRMLGDKVAFARDHSESLEEFREHLRWSGVQLDVLMKADKDGVMHECWRYQMEDVLGTKHRKRRRKADKLADDLTKESIERFYVEKEAEKNNPPTNAEMPIEEMESKEEEDYGSVNAETEEPNLFDSFTVEEEDVSLFAKDLDKAFCQQYRREGTRRGEGRCYLGIKQALMHPKEYASKLQEQVDEAREEFKRAKEYREEMRCQAAPNLYGIMRLFDICRKKAKTPFERMMDDMFSQMMKNLLKVFAAEQRRREIEEAERKLYKSRRKMWDDEKRLKAAHVIVKKEKARSVRKTRSLMQDIEEAEKRGGEDFEFGE